MKKVLYTLAALSFVFVACNKQEIVLEEESSQEGELTTVTIKASNGDADTKAAIADETRAFTWTIGDQIAVHTDAGRFYTSDALTTGGTTADFTVSLSGNRNGYAVYPASVAKSYSGSTLTLTLPSEYTYAQVSEENTPLPMIAKDEGGNLSFKQICGLLRLTVTEGIPEHTKKLTVKFNGMNVSGTFAVQNPATSTPYIESTPYYSSDRETADDVITITSESDIDNGTVVNIPLPTGTYSDIAVMAYDAEGNGTVVGITTVSTAATYNVTRAVGKKRSIVLDNNKFFSIADKKYAFIAPGNLQYQANPGTWRFAENQYDYVGGGSAGGNVEGSDNTKIASDYSGWIDLFGWGTSGYTTEGWYEYYQPWTSDDYYNNKYGPNGFYDLTGSYKRGDWGMNNTIGSYQPGTWRTPSASSTGEWQYLLDRTNSFAKAIVAGVWGVILLPDAYVHPDGVTALSNVDVQDVDFSSNVYDATVWLKMQNAGAIFLPCAGYRLGTDILTVGSQGNYFSSTSTTSGTIYNAYNLLFRQKTPSNSVVTASYAVNRRLGNSVRLIRDLN